VLNEVVFNQVLVQCETDALTAQTLERIQTMRTCWVGGSQWHGRKVIRVSICSWVTTEKDISLTLEAFATALRP
jgi:threonine aldolase